MCLSELFRQDVFRAFVGDVDNSKHDRINHALLSSVASFVTSTRLIRSGVDAIDSPDQSRQDFEQYDTSKVLEKVFQSTF